MQKAFGSRLTCRKTLLKQYPWETCCVCCAESAAAAAYPSLKETNHSRAPSRQCTTVPAVFPGAMSRHVKLLPPCSRTLGCVSPLFSNQILPKMILKVCHEIVCTFSGKTEMV